MIELVINLLRLRDVLGREGRREAETLIDTLTDEQCREIIKVVDAEELGAPRNLFFNYKTQEWRE